MSASNSNQASRKEITEEGDGVVGLATVQIPPHDITSIELTDKGEYVQAHFHDNAETMDLYLILPSEAVDELRQQLEEIGGRALA